MSLALGEAFWDGSLCSCWVLASTWWLSCLCTVWAPGVQSLTGERCVQIDGRSLLLDSPGSASLRRLPALSLRLSWWQSWALKAPHSQSRRHGQWDHEAGV